MKKAVRQRKGIPLRSHTGAQPLFAPSKENFLSASLVQRQCNNCGQEEKLQRKENNAAAPATAQLSGFLSSLSGSGQSLSGSQQQFFAPRMGHSFSQVKIHTGAAAAQSARQINAKAYTHKNHIVFAEGQYKPETQEGKKLLAHELTHVVQQSGNPQSAAIQRCPDAAQQSQFDTRAAAVRQMPQYISLTGEQRIVAEQIIQISGTRDNCLSLMTSLETLFRTVQVPGGSVTRQMREGTATSLREHRAALRTPAGRASLREEENISHSPNRRWTPLRGRRGNTYYVDRTDPANIVVLARVHLSNISPQDLPGAVGNQRDIRNIRALEDMIENLASTRGYTVDLEFTDRPGPDVFDIFVEPSRWVVERNWTFHARAIAHELHHSFGLEDRYDYIEAHADNDSMPVSQRLMLFRQQLDRQPDPGRMQSFMGSGDQILDDDVCRTAQMDVAYCSAVRSGRLRHNLLFRGIPENFASVPMPPVPGLQPPTMQVPGFSAPRLTLNMPALTLPPITPVPFTLNHFALGRAGLTATHRNQIRGMAAIILATMRQNPAIRIRVEGFTDASGQAEANFNLGMERGAAVRDQLVTEGIDSSRIQVFSLGATELVEATMGASGLNRRVVIQITGMGPN